MIPGCRTRGREKSSRWAAERKERDAPDSPLAALTAAWVVFLMEEAKVNHACLISELLTHIYPFNMTLVYSSINIFPYWNKSSIK